VAIQPIYAQIGLLSLAFLALYYPFITTLVRDWDTNESYSQGYFIPFVSAYMIWSLRGELAATELKPSNWGLALVALGLLQLFVAKVGSEFFLQRTSMIVVDIIRLTVTAILASRYGGEVAHGFLHDFSGWLVFVAGIALLIGVQVLLNKLGNSK
jgi:exosortase/archaeosortase family protein